MYASYHCTEIIRSEDNLWSVQGMTLLPKVRCLALFEMLPSGADLDGHKISAVPFLDEYVWSNGASQ